jgi:hypothetical protein
MTNAKARTRARASKTITVQASLRLVTYDRQNILKVLPILILCQSIVKYQIMKEMSLLKSRSHKTFLVEINSLYRKARSFYSTEKCTFR